MKFYILVLCVCFVMSGCSGLTNGKAADKTTLTDAEEFADRKDQNQAVEQQFISVERPGQSPLQIPVNDISDLQSYINQSSDPEIEIQRITTNNLFQKDNNEYILVGYGCGIKLCSWLLVEHDNGKFRSIEVSDASFYQQFELWNSYLALKFGQNELNVVVRNQIVIINLQNMKLVPLPADLAYLTTFEYPIPDLKWINGALRVSIADISDTSFESLEKWFKLPTPPVRKVEWNIK